MSSRGMPAIAENSQPENSVIRDTLEEILKSKHFHTSKQCSDLLRYIVEHSLISGDASQVADQLLSWVAETGIDGFNLTRTVVPECHESFVDLVVPALQDRDAYKTSYEEGTLRHKLHGEGDRLPERHAGSAFRRSPS